MNGDHEHGPGHPGHPGNAPDGMSEHAGMSPYLFTDTRDFFVLFQDANIKSTGGFIGALAASLVFTLLATVLSLLLHVHEHRAIVSEQSSARFTAAFLYAFRQFLHYTAMLLVMTMNIWIIIAVLAGHVVGWLIFAFLFGNRIADAKTVAHKTDEL